MIFKFRKAQATASLICTSEHYSQKVVIEAAAIKHVTRYRQLKSWATEAGGQLFGSISPEQITIALATGPYRGDERSRHRYRSKPDEAQDAIQKCAARGMLYLGEWHTHAEDRPNASSLDDDAMKLLLANSRLNSDTLLLLIVGRVAPADGLALWTVSKSHAYDWQVNAKTAALA